MFGAKTRASTTREKAMEQYVYVVCEPLGVIATELLVAVDDVHRR